jgi:xanthine dehydrogenase accessory factor
MSCQGGGSLQIFLEPMLPRPTLLVLGESPAAQELKRLGESMGFVIERDASVVDARTYVVVCTQGQGDEEALHSVLGRGAAYLGLVCNEKKAEALYAYLRSRGVTEEALAKVKRPSGLFVGTTPQETALATIAEIVALRCAEKTAPAAEPPVEETSVDPVCGMIVSVAGAKFTAVHEGRRVYFCCAGCCGTFEADPSVYPLR